MNRELTIREFSQKLHVVEKDELTEALHKISEVVDAEMVRDSYREIPEVDRFGWG